MARAKFGILGGSGLYALAGLADVEEVAVTTPFGPPSDTLRVGRVENESVAFLARHGRGHQLLPSEINYRANIFALKLLGVERILSASAVGSMREGIRPRDLVLVDQFIDRAQHRAATFFGEGVVAHVSLADPVCPEVRQALLSTARGQGATAHDGGVYLCMGGPAFSTRAESRLYRSFHVDVIGMTNATEAKLAREAEICYATLALVTDYDCWHEVEEAVSVAALLENLHANSELASHVIREAIRSLSGRARGCDCGAALTHAILTPPAAIGPAARERLAPILGRYLGTTQP